MQQTKTSGTFLAPIGYTVALIESSTSSRPTYLWYPLSFTTVRYFSPAPPQMLSADKASDECLYARSRHIRVLNKFQDVSGEYIGKAIRFFTKTTIPFNLNGIHPEFAIYNRTLTRFSLFGFHTKCSVCYRRKDNNVADFKHFQNEFAFSFVRVEGKQRIDEGLSSSGFHDAKGKGGSLRVVFKENKSQVYNLN